jgi:hypothetical protein
MLLQVSVLHMCLYLYADRFYSPIIIVFLEHPIIMLSTILREILLLLTSPSTRASAQATTLF